MFHTRRDSSIKIGGLFQESEGENRTALCGRNKFS